MSARAKCHGSYKKNSVLTFNRKLYVVKYNLGEVKIESSQCDGAWCLVDATYRVVMVTFWAHVQLPSVSPGTLFGGFNCQDFQH